MQNKQTKDSNEKNRFIALFRTKYRNYIALNNII